jgi:hypothetical protein
MPLTKLDVDQLPNVNLNRYSTLILVNGNYWTFERNNHQIEQWVQNGGTLIAYQDAIKWLNTAKLIELTLKQIKMKLKNISFEEKDDFRGAQLVAGAIFEAQLDLSHQSILECQEINYQCSEIRLYS